MPANPTEPPAPFPPAILRYEHRVAAVFVCTALGAVATPFVADWFSPLWALPGIPIAIVTTTFGSMWCMRRHSARIKVAVVAASGRACVGCVYNLSGMGETGACPECGRPFNVAEDRRSWARAGM